MRVRIVRMNLNEECESLDLLEDKTPHTCKIHRGFKNIHGGTRISLCWEKHSFEKRTTRTRVANVALGRCIKKRKENMRIFAEPPLSWRLHRIRQASCSKRPAARDGSAPRNNNFGHVPSRKLCQCRMLACFSLASSRFAACWQLIAYLEAQKQ
jgi:hypothetical protein